MQAPKRLSIKLFASNPDVITAEAILPIFQEWIQRNAIENELLIDVVDYKHVHHGPGIILIGYEGDYGYDFTGGRVGLQYTLKQNTSESLLASIKLIFDRILHASHLLHAEIRANNLKLATNEFQITILDRLHYPNTVATIAALQEELTAPLTDIFGESVNVVIEAGTNQSDPIRVIISQREGFDLTSIQGQSVYSQNI